MSQQLLKYLKTIYNQIHNILIKMGELILYCTVNLNISRGIKQNLLCWGTAAAGPPSSDTRYGNSMHI
jgi:hypothetical protein